MPRRARTHVQLSDLRFSGGPEEIHGIADIVRAWDHVPPDIQEAIMSIVEATIKKPGKISSRAIAVKNLYLELVSDPKHFPTQESIVKEIMKRAGISARSTVMKHLKTIRENDLSFPSADGPKT